MYTFKRKGLSFNLGVGFENGKVGFLFFNKHFIKAELYFRKKDIATCKDVKIIYRVAQVFCSFFVYF